MKITQEDVVLMQTLRDDGMSVQDIADKFDCQKSTVYIKTFSERKSISVSHLKVITLTGEIINEETVLTHNKVALYKLVPIIGVVAV